MDRKALTIAACTESEANSQALHDKLFGPELNWIQGLWDITNVKERGLQPRPDKPRRTRQRHQYRTAEYRSTPKLVRSLAAQG